MKIGVIGLGRMGSAIAARLVEDGHTVFGFDVNQETRLNARKEGIITVESLTEIAQHVRIFWLMVPAGEIVDITIQALIPFLQAGDIIVDGGNSRFTDSIKRAQELEQKHITFVDCGTSGGLEGRTVGFCLMIGGKKHVFDYLEPAFISLATPEGYAYMGPSGSGHYVKMVHNGVEYALMQAYAEGFHVIKEGFFKDQHLDLENIARVWNNGSIIRSWLLSLTLQALHEDQDLSTISGYVSETGMGQWTMEDAQKHHIPMPTLKEALATRKWSRETGGNYATKLIALIRNKMGGHAFKQKDS